MSGFRRRGRIEKHGRRFRVELRLEDGPDGERRRIRRSFETRKEAERFLAEKVVELDEERENGAGGRFTVEQAIGLWHTAKKHTPKTRYEYELAEKLIPAKLLERRLDEVKVGDVRKALDEIRNAGRSEWRVKKVYEILSGTFDHAWRNEWIRESVVRRVPRPNPRRVRPKPPKPDELEVLVARASEEAPELMLWIRIASTTGARRGEVAALRWEDVDFGSKTIRFHRAKSYAPKASDDGDVGSGVFEKLTKTEDDRLVAVGERLLDELRAAMRVQIERADRMGVEWDPAHYVIAADEVGLRGWRPDRATRVFRELRKELGLPESLTLKTLRHYVATELLAAGVDVRTVAGRLGHAQTSTTTDVYAQWVHEADERAARLLD